MVASPTPPFTHIFSQNFSDDVWWLPLLSVLKNPLLEFSTPRVVFSLRIPRSLVESEGRVCVLYLSSGKGETFDESGEGGGGGGGEGR